MQVIDLKGKKEKILTVLTLMGSNHFQQFSCVLIVKFESLNSPPFDFERNLIFERVVHCERRKKIDAVIFNVEN